MNKSVDQKKKPIKQMEKGWVKKNQLAEIAVNMSMALPEKRSEVLTFKAFDRKMGTGVKTINCERHRREFIFGDPNWKFDFSGALGVLMKPRGGRPRKLT